jgi:exopolysaccharide biosynthesis predicted pyruvyltransferase EpsI
MAKMNVLGTEISGVRINDDDYISLTDMDRNIEKVSFLFSTSCVIVIRLNFLVFGKRFTTPILILPNSTGLKANQV